MENMSPLGNKMMVKGPTGQMIELVLKETSTNLPPHSAPMGLVVACKSTPAEFARRQALKENADGSINCAYNSYQVVSPSVAVQGSVNLASGSVDCSTDSQKTVAEVLTTKKTKNKKTKTKAKAYDSLSSEDKQGRLCVQCNLFTFTYS